MYPLALGTRTLRRIMRKANVNATVALNPAPGRVMMSKSNAFGLVFASAILLAMLLAGCTGAPSPTTGPEAGAIVIATATPKATPETTLEPTLMPTLAPTPTPALTSTPIQAASAVPAASALTLDEYLSWCVTILEELPVEEDSSFGQVSARLAEFLQTLEAMVPPAEVVEWHLLYIELFRTFQAVYDILPEDDLEDFGVVQEFLQTEGRDFEERYTGLEEQLSEVALRMPDEVREEMLEVECIESYLVPDEYDEPDDHGNDFGSASRVAIGEEVRFELGFRLDKDVLVFSAKAGTEYEFTLDFEEVGYLRASARPILALFDGTGQELGRVDHALYGSDGKLMWQALSRGDYYIEIGDRLTHGIGTVTFSEVTVADVPVAGPDTGTGPATPLSLDAYLMLCPPTTDDLGDDYTFGDFASDVGAEADGLEAIIPPVELAEWHWERVEVFRTVEEILNHYPKDEVVDFAGMLLIAAASTELVEKLGEVAAGLPQEVLEQLIEAGCVDPGDLPVFDEFERDDHGNSFAGATRIGVGEAVGLELEDIDDEDVIVFRAGAGREYVLTLHWEQYHYREVDYTERPILAVYSSNGQEHSRLMGYEFTGLDPPIIDLMWEAAWGEDYYIVIGDGNTEGVAEFSVTRHSPSVVDEFERDDHGNDFAGATRLGEGEGVRVELEDFEDRDVIVFRAEARSVYALTLHWEHYQFRDHYSEQPILGVYSANGQEHAGLMGYEFTGLDPPVIDLMWQASSGVDYYFVIGDGNTQGAAEFYVTWHPQ